MFNGSRLFPPLNSDGRGVVTLALLLAVALSPFSTGLALLCVGGGGVGLAAFCLPVPHCA